MKNTAQEGARGRAGRDSPPPKRGGCGRHAPPQKDSCLRSIGGRAPMANPARLRARGNKGARTPQTQSGCREKPRATPAPLSRPQGERAPSRPRRGARVANGAPGSTPGAGARKGQRGQRTRTAWYAGRTPTRPDNDHGKQLLKTQRYEHTRGSGVRQPRTRSRPRGARSGQARTAQTASG